MEPRQAILVVSFGTSYNDSREKTIGAVERAVAEAFPAYEVRRAFTSQRIIDKLKKRDQRSIDNLKEALDRAAADGIKSLIVQPTHLMDGFEYMDVKAEVEANQGRFERLALGAPLLASEADLDAVILAMAGELGGYDDGKTALCLMGHGTDAASNQVYQKMQDRMIAGGYANYYIGTVEAQPDLQAVIEKLGAQKHYQRAVRRSWWLQATMRIRIWQVKRRIPGRAAWNAPDTRWNAASGDWERLRRSGSCMWRT